MADEEHAAQIFGERTSELSVLRQNQLDMVATMERDLHTNMQLLESMTASQNAVRRDLEERFRLFSQNVQAPLVQAVTTSSGIAQASNAMAGAVTDFRADLARTVHEAEEANRLAQQQRMEAQQQALQSVQELAHAQESLARHREETTSRGAPVEDLRRPSTSSEFGSRFNAFSPPASVEFATAMGSRTQNHQEPPRMSYLERPQVQTSSFGPIGMSVDRPVYQPQGPQVIIIQRASVDLLNHVPMYNGGSIAAAISFIGAAENAKRNDAETSARMIVAVGARLSDVPHNGSKLFRLQH